MTPLTCNMDTGTGLAVPPGSQTPMPISPVGDTGDRAPREPAAWHRLDALLAELSGRFVNLPADRVEQHIEEALRSIRDALDLDHCLLAQRAENEADMAVTHSAAARGLEPTPKVALAAVPWVERKIPAGAMVTGHLMEDLIPATTSEDQAKSRGLDLMSAMSFPLRVGGILIGLFAVAATRAQPVWPDPARDRLRLVGDILASALARQRSAQALRDSEERRKLSTAELHTAQAELRRLQGQLRNDNVCLSEDLKGSHGTRRIIGKSPALRRALAQVEQVAPTPATVLITGETGTGKELFAADIHRLSIRHGSPMVRVNCAAIPAALIESELFGREKGAYTGALAKQVGRFEIAHGSTIFLDEVSEVPLDAQAKLLRVLQEKEIERLGSPRTIKVDVRVIAATNRDLAKAVAEGRFREDLYYRLNVFPIAVPALRERREDIPLLVAAFVDEFAQSMGKPIDSIARSSLQALQGYHWPGNVRELRNLIERSVIIATGSTLTIDLPQSPDGTPSGLMTLAEAERAHVAAVLDTTGWRIRGAGGAADVLGLKPSTLESRMAKLGIRRPSR